MANMKTENSNLKESITAFGKVNTDIITIRKNISIINSAVNGLQGILNVGSISDNLSSINAYIQQINRIAVTVDSDYVSIPDFSLKSLTIKGYGEQFFDESVQISYLRNFLNEKLTPQINKLNKKIKATKTLVFENCYDELTKVIKKYESVQNKLKGIEVESSSFSINKVKKRISETKEHMKSFQTELNNYKKYERGIK